MRSIPAWIPVCGAALALAVLALPPSTEAGIGIPKKVKDAVGKTAEQKAPQEKTAAAPDEPVVFDNLILELDAERIAGILTAFDRAKKVNAGRPALVSKLEKASEEKEKIVVKHGERVQDDQRKRDEVNTCRHDGYRAVQDRKTQEYSQKALTDPAIREKYTKVAMEQNAAAAAGDSTAIRKINEVLMSEILPSKEDSARVRQECPPMPPVSPEEKRMDALDTEIASLNEQIRDIDNKVAAEQGGLTREQWGVALERIQMFLSEKKRDASSSPKGFSEEEIEAMEKRLEELKAALGWS